MVEVDCWIATRVSSSAKDWSRMKEGTWQERNKTRSLKMEWATGEIDYRNVNQTDSASQQDLFETPDGEQRGRITSGKHGPTQDSQEAQ